jgi:hypothetical protein
MKAIPRKIARGLLLLILFCGTPHALAEIQVTITSITQDSADAASPYIFTVNFSALETSKTNRFVSSAELLVNDNVVGDCATGSGGTIGNPEIVFNKTIKRLSLYREKGLYQSLCKPPYLCPLLIEPSAHAAS